MPVAGCPATTWRNRYGGSVFHWIERDDRFVRAFTDRKGGVSRGPYAGLNLGRHVGDDADTVTANRAAVADALGLAPDHVIYVSQVHGTAVEHVTGPQTGAVPEADGLVTDRPGVALAMMVADCTPVLLVDEQTGILGAAHAGRPGMVAGVIPAVVAAMRDLGARAPQATVGPSVCGRCYEVPAAMRDQAAAVAPESAARTWIGTPAIDVATGVVAQLDGLGVPVTWVAGCTREDEALYSYRRDGTTGRFAGIVLRHG